ncbi:unnamed protein product [Penicillium salamii]|nr:unnamed protein product [Penicillium salamii]CAG7995373.1 unnamed protein product [Penicillium salamii]CAG8300767.1 unnamed protein product [Penicillium salamii]
MDISENLRGTREIAEKNVKKLLKTFEIEGCSNLKPKYRVSIIIEQKVLRRALAKSNLIREALLDPTNQSNLILEEEDLIICIYGKHCLKASERFGEIT